MEQRKHSRYVVQFPITFSGEQIEGEGTASNLSTQGCAVESERSAPLGSYIKLRLYLPDQVPIPVDVAAVRWSRSRAFGLEFIGMAIEDQQRLQRFVAALNHPA
jgi:hypothetical protein